MSRPREGDQIHTEHVELGDLLLQAGGLQSWDWRDWVGEQTNTSSIWIAFGSQAVLWLLCLKDQDVTALGAFDKL